TVPGAAPSQFEPSLFRNTAALPRVAEKRRCTFAGVIVQALSAWWHDAQVRLLLPRSWKNGFCRSIGPPVVNVVAMPASFGYVSTRLSCWLAPALAPTRVAASSAAQSTAAPVKRRVFIGYLLGLG